MVNPYMGVAPSTFYMKNVQIIRKALQYILSMLNFKQHKELKIYDVSVLQVVQTGSFQMTVFQLPSDGPPWLSRLLARRRDLQASKLKSAMATPQPLWGQ